MIFRKIEINEIEQVYNIYCIEENIELLKTHVKKAEKVYEEMLKRGSYTYGCFIEGELVAVINANKILDYYPNYQEFPYVHLETCIVKKQFQNKGIGTQLVKNLIEQLEKEGVTYIIAQSRVIGAQKQLEKAGLINIGEIDYRKKYVN